MNGTGRWKGLVIRDGRFRVYAPDGVSYTFNSMTTAVACAGHMNWLYLVRREDYGAWSYG